MGAATSTPEDLQEPTSQVFKVRYIWESAPNTWKCPGTSQTVELTDITPPYLPKVGAQFTNKTSHLTLCLLQNAIHLHPESILIYRKSKQNRIVLLVLQASIMKNVISTMIKIYTFILFLHSKNRIIYQKAGKHCNNWLHITLCLILGRQSKKKTTLIF